MIKNIQERMNNGSLKKYINWYCWNGTKFPCNFNRLPLKGNEIRNTGLVFQSDNFNSIVSTKVTHYETKKFTNKEDIIISNDKYIFKVICDNINITNNLKNTIKSIDNNLENFILTEKHFEDCNIPVNFNNLFITYKWDE